jgi:hypothetical protein
MSKRSDLNTLTILVVYTILGLLLLAATFGTAASKVEARRNHNTFNQGVE